MGMNVAHTDTQPSLRYLQLALRSTILHHDLSISSCTKLRGAEYTYHAFVMDT